MSYTTPQDISVTITVSDTTPTTSTNQPNILVRTERRITPTWTISQLKSKLEPITGIPYSSQLIRHTTIELTPDTALLNNPGFSIRRGSELQVIDLRPAALRQNFADTSLVDKYEMPVSQYEKLDDTVLAWKKRQGLGRFDPSVASVEETVKVRRNADRAWVRTREIEVGKRCRVGGEDERRGIVRFVGEIEGLGGEKERGCIWVGVELDEPVGRNDGSVRIEREGGKTTVEKVFDCKEKFGVFARPEKIETGDFPPLDDFDEDMEEI